jgi:hypothetical protein
MDQLSVDVMRECHLSLRFVNVEFDKEDITVNFLTYGRDVDPIDRRWANSLEPLCILEWTTVAEWEIVYSFEYNYIECSLRSETVGSCNVSSINHRYGPARVERSETRAGPYRPPV